MIRKLKAMLGLAPKRERPQPDPIAASVAIAVQRNEAAGMRARQVLEEVLAKNDAIRGRAQ
jgi:hypothetical protein